MGNGFTMSKFKDHLMPDLKAAFKNAFDRESPEYTPENQEMAYRELIDVVKLFQHIHHKKEREQQQLLQSIRELQELQKELHDKHYGPQDESSSHKPSE